MNENNSQNKSATDNKQESVINELRSKLDKELVTLLAHPLVPAEFKAVFEENE